jgi:hypothetical protein
MRGGVRSETSTSHSRINSDARLRVALPSALVQRLQQIAEADGLTLSSTARRLLSRVVLPQRTAFTLDGEGEATLKLVVPEQFARALSDNIHRLRNCSFVVRIEGLEN